jgi:hypothetical protein
MVELRKSLVFGESTLKRYKHKHEKVFPSGHYLLGNNLLPRHKNKHQTIFPGGHFLLGKNVLPSIEQVLEKIELNKIHYDRHHVRVNRLDQSKFMKTAFNCLESSLDQAVTDICTLSYKGPQEWLKDIQEINSNHQDWAEKHAMKLIEHYNCVIDALKKIEKCLYQIQLILEAFDD